MKTRYMAPALLAMLTATAWGFDRQTEPKHQSRAEVIARNGMVATSLPLATAAGLEILTDGGNAIDAAVAAAAVQTVGEPMMTGAAADLFAIIWVEKEQRLYGLNASGYAGSKATIENFKARGLESVPSLGLDAVTVPGGVDGWNQMLERFGSRSLGDCLKRAIEYAEEGMPVTPVVQYYWEREADALVNEDARRIYLPVPRTGDIIRNPELAETYRHMAEQPDSFYRGPLAEKIAAFMEKEGGLITLADLNDYHAEWIDPISTSYRGVTLYEMPPSGQGIAALMILNILEGFDFSTVTWGSPEHIHPMVEAKRLAYADLHELVGDPAKVKVPVERMLSKEYAAERRALIQPNRAMTEVGPGISFEGDTIYLATADREGNMVSLIQSVAGVWGAGVVVEGTGLLLQNRGAGVKLEPNLAKTLAPRKKPFHTIIPAFAMRDGKPWLAYGVQGGSMQPQGHVQIMVNLVDYGMNLQQAADAPRWRMEQELSVESGISETTTAALEGMGHVLTPTRPAFTYGGFQGIMRDEARGVYIGASEPRKDGMAAGY